MLNPPLTPCRYASHTLSLTSRCSCVIRDGWVEHRVVRSTLLCVHAAHISLELFCGHHDDLPPYSIARRARGSDGAIQNDPHDLCENVSTSRQTSSWFGAPLFARSHVLWRLKCRTRPSLNRRPTPASARDLRGDAGPPLQGRGRVRSARSRRRPAPPRPRLRRVGLCRPHLRGRGRARAALPPRASGHGLMDAARARTPAVEGRRGARRARADLPRSRGGLEDVPAPHRDRRRRARSGREGVSVLPRLRAPRPGYRGVPASRSHRERTGVGADAERRRPRDPRRRRERRRAASSRSATSARTYRGGAFSRTSSRTASY